MNYYFLSYDRKNDVDSEELRQQIINLLLQKECKLSSNEESSMCIRSELSYESLSELLQLFDDSMFFTLLQISLDDKGSPIMTIEKNEEHQTYFYNLVRHMVLLNKL